MPVVDRILNNQAIPNPLFPVPFSPAADNAALLPAVPLRYGSAGTLYGIQLAAELGDDRRLILTKNRDVITEISSRQSDQNNFIQLQLPIGLNDVFRVHGEMDSAGAGELLYCSLVTSVKLNNAFWDFGAQDRSDFSFDTGTDIQNVSSKTFAQLTSAQLNARYFDGRRMEIVATAGGNGVVLWRETYGGRTGTNFYVKLVMEATTTIGGFGGFGFLVQASGTNTGYMLGMYDQATAADHGIRRINGATHAAVAISNEAIPSSEPQVLEAIMQGNNFVYIRNRVVKAIARDTNVTAAGSFGAWTDTTANNTSTRNLLNVLGMVAA